MMEDIARERDGVAPILPTNPSRFTSRPTIQTYALRFGRVVAIFPRWVARDSGERVGFGLRHVASDDWRHSQIAGLTGAAHGKCRHACDGVGFSGHASLLCLLCVCVYVRLGDFWAISLGETVLHSSCSELSH